MTGVTSSRHEWYDEDPFPEVPLRTGGSIPHVHFVLQQGRYVGKTHALESFVEAAQAAGMVIGTKMHGLVIAFNKLGQAVPFAGDKNLKDESVRDRALRLRKQGHSMSSDHARVDFRVRRNH